MERAPFHSNPRDQVQELPGEEREGRRIAMEEPSYLSPARTHTTPVVHGRSDSLFDGKVLPPIQEAASPHHHMHRPYGSIRDRALFDPSRRAGPSSSSYAPAGMVTPASGYLASRRSPGPSSAIPPFHHLPRHPVEPYGYEAAPSFGPPRGHPIPSGSLEAPPHPRTPGESDSISVHTPIKRPRVSLACLACRNRKSRCDGVRPTCKTCTSMKIDCKWPEIDFRRAKTGDAGRQRRKSSADPPSSGNRSPESAMVRSRAADSSSNILPLSRSVPERVLSTTLPSSVSAPNFAVHHSGDVPPTRIADHSPVSRTDRFGPSAEAGRNLRELDTFPGIRSTSDRERYIGPGLTDDDRRVPLLRSSSHVRPYSSESVPVSHRGRNLWSEEQTYASSYDPRKIGRRPAERLTPPPQRPEQRSSEFNLAAGLCRARARQIAILARPTADAQRNAVEKAMIREASLEDLVDGNSPGERLEIAFSSDWDTLGGLPATARRPFMDVVSGILGIVELTGGIHGSGHQEGTPKNGRLHLFRLRNGMHAVPDLRHISVALDLQALDERELKESSTTYNALTYPIPVDRLNFSLVSSVQRGLAERQAKEEEVGNTSAKSPRSPIHQTPGKKESVPVVAQSEVKPARATTERFFQAFVEEIGEQMPGLDVALIDARIREGSISALLANALCCIGASLFERAGRRLSSPDALSSEVYSDRARALLGPSLCEPDLETILSLGVLGIRDILMGYLTSAATIVSSAARMCLQLDLHRSRASSSPPLVPSSELNESTLFWMVYCLDRIIALATARPVTIRDQDIDVAFPSTIRKAEPCIFAALVRQLHYAGRLADVSTSAHPEAQASSRGKDLAAIETDLVGHYDSLPATLRLSASNLQRSHEMGQGLSFLQLHLTHYSALIQRFLLSDGPMSDVEYDAMRTAARQIGEICVLSQALNGKAMSESPLSSMGCFLSGCVSLAELEFLSAQDSPLPREDYGSSSSSSSSRDIKLQIDAARANLAKVMDALDRQGKFWPGARSQFEILRGRASLPSSAKISEAVVSTLVSQLEAIQVIVRRPDSRSGPDASTPSDASNAELLTVQRVTDLDRLLSTFPHLC